MGGVAAISGEPGIGKTTLARAVGSIVAARGVPVLWGRGIESAPVYWPWLQVLRARADAVGEAVARVELGRDGALERELGDDPIDGLIATYAGAGPEGMCVISVWESKAHADRFTAELLVPTLRRLGVTPDQQTRHSVLEIELDDTTTRPRRPSTVDA
jgi:hypothetical protein